MNKSVQNFQELHINLCLNMHCLDDYLKTIGIEVKKNRYFIVTNDGNCWIIDPKKFDISFTEKDCIADGKIKYLPKNFLFNFNIKKIKIPSSITSIGYYTFSDCSSLTSVMISDSVTSIGYHAFYNCISLTSVTIPDSVTSIGYEAFGGCTNLANVTIGNGIMSIGLYAFDCCNNLKNLIFKDKTLNEVRRMKYYPWRIEDESIISVA